MKTVVIPTFRNIAVVPLLDQKAKENAAAGIIVPDNSGNGPSRKGTIKAIGPSVDTNMFAVGDVVAYKNYGYESFKVDGEEVLVMADENVVVTFKEEAGE